MAGDDLVLVADQNRVGEAEASDAVGDLSDLLPGMGARVLRVGSQPCDWRDLDVGSMMFHVFPRQRHVSKGTRTER